MRHPHLKLPPLGSLALIEAPHFPVAKVGNEPAFEVRTEVSLSDLLDEQMMIYDVEGFGKVDAKETSPCGRFFGVEARGDLVGQGKKS